MTEPRMNPEIKAQWVAALRSGKYRQGTLALRYKNKYCCLGVLCDLAVEPLKLRVSPDNLEVEDGLDPARVYYNDETNYLPEEVQEWSGVSRKGVIAGDYFYDNEHFHTLAELNDQGMSFAEIADVIEQKF